MTKKNKMSVKRIGPGTMAMFVGVGAFALYSFTTKPTAPTAVYFEADSSGKLARIERSTTPKSAPRHLFKPEPQWLIQRADKLSLSDRQLMSIRRIDELWTREKTGFERRFKSYANLVSTQNAKPASTVALQESLGDYSALSRRFDFQRSEAWNRSVDVLTADQRRLLDALLEAIR